jgi:alpha-L-fucosidase 2
LPESIAISGDASQELIIGDTLNLSANVTPANATNKSVSWVSSNPAVATVNANGLVQAIAEGEVSITAKIANGDHTAAVTIKVAPIRVTGISIQGDATRWLVVGQSGETQLTAVIAPANASNKAVTWTSSDPTIATVSPTGRVITRAIGNAIITATSADGGFIASVDLIVRIPVQSVSIDGDRFLNLKVGREHPLTTTITPENATIKTVNWSTTNETVAMVDQDGLVRAVAPGNAVIIVTTEDGNRTSAVNITVAAADFSPYFSEGNSTTLRYRGSKKLTFNSSVKARSWASDKPEIVSVVDQDGNIYGAKRGTARVIAIDENGAPAEISVTVDYVWWQWLIVIFLFGWAWY